VPVVSAIVHHSFGDSSFFTGMSDYVVQLTGACLALTGPRVLAVGTSEQVTMEDAIELLRDQEQWLYSLV